MFKTSLTIGNAFRRLQEIPGKAAEKFRQRIGAEVSADLQRRVLEIMAEDPGVPSSPFAFGTDRSARFWFWLVTQFPELTDGAHWIRTGDLEQSWQTAVVVSGFHTEISVYSFKPQARYVYGPWTVPGHANTGWPDKYERARALVLAEARRVTFRTWDSAVYNAAKEVGL